MAVNILYQGYHEQLEYLNKHNIPEVKGQDLYGCCIAKTELRNVTNGSIIIFETFDKKLYGITLDQLIMAEMDYKNNSETSPRSFEMINMELGYGLGHRYKEHYNRSKYCPTEESITQYVVNNWGKQYEYLMPGDIIVKETGLSKDRLNKMIYKVKMTGLACGLVDYNTVAVGQNGKLSIYSMQKKVITYTDDFGYVKLR